jgi:hypothetical protein
MSQKSVVINAVGMLSPHSKPTTIIPAPGPGKYIWVQSAVFEYAFGTADYAVAGSLYYNGPTPTRLAAEQMPVGHGGSAVSMILEAAGENWFASTAVGNEAVLYYGPTDSSVGDGTGIVTVNYVIRNTP